MIIRVHDTATDGNKMVRRTWSFWWSNNRLGLTCYRVLQKTTRQRVWREVAKWQQHHTGRHGYLKLEEVPRPQWVAYKAHEFANTLLRAVVYVQGEEIPFSVHRHGPCGEVTTE